MNERRSVYSRQPFGGRWRLPARLRDMTFIGCKGFNSPLSPQLSTTVQSAASQRAEPRALRHLGQKTVRHGTPVGAGV